MRLIVAVLLLPVGLAVWGPQASDKGKPLPRYGIDFDARLYPQTTPKDTLGSVLKAIGLKQFDYMLAQLADPVFVDKQVAAIAAKMDAKVPEAQRTTFAFGQLVESTSRRFLDDPGKIRDLQRFHDEAEWTETGDEAVGNLKGLKSQAVFMKKAGPDRWVMLDREK